MNLKFILKKLIRKSLFFTSFFIKYFYNKKRILLIPPTILDGSFGDELMVVSFFDNNNCPIDLYTEEDRKDLYSKYNNVNFINNYRSIRWYKYKKIVVLGADNITGAYGIERPLKKIEILKIANKLKVRTEILGFSLKEETKTLILKELNFISKNTNLYLRDIDSFERAKKFNLKNITLVSDLAFLTPFYKLKNERFIEWINTNKGNGNTIIGICPNAIHANQIGLQKYISDFTFFLKKISENKKISFVFLYHDLRRHCKEMSDKDISKILYDENKNTLSCYFEENIQNGIVMKSYIELVDFTLSGRMHFGISGLSLGKPLLGITYEDKFSGLQKLFKINPKESLINDYSNINDYIDTANSFIENLSEYQQKIAKELPNVKELSKLNFK